MQELTHPAVLVLRVQIGDELGFEVVNVHTDFPGIGRAAPQAHSDGPNQQHLTLLYQR